MKNKHSFGIIYFVAGLVAFLIIGQFAVSYQTLSKLKEKELIAYEAVALEDFSAYIENNYLGINNLSTTSAKIDEKGRAEELQEIFDTITESDRYAYMAVLKDSKVVVESSSNKYIVKKRGDIKWRPIKRYKGSFKGAFIGEDGHYFAAIKKEKANIITLAFIDCNPEFEHLASDRYAWGVKIKVTLDGHVIFKSHDFVEPSSLTTKYRTFRDNQSGIEFLAVHEIPMFSQDNKYQYLFLLVAILNCIVLTLVFIYRPFSKIYKMALIETNNLQELKTIKENLKLSLLTPSIVNRIANTLVEKQEMVNKMFVAQSGDFHCLKNRSEEALDQFKTYANTKNEESLTICHAVSRFNKQTEEVLAQLMESYKKEGNINVHAIVPAISLMNRQLEDILKLFKAPFGSSNEEYYSLCAGLSLINQVASEGEEKANEVYSKKEKNRNVLTNLGLLVSTNHLISHYASLGIEIEINERGDDFYGVYAKLPPMDMNTILNCIYENAKKAVEKQSKKFYIDVRKVGGCAVIVVSNIIKDGLDGEAIVKKMNIRLSDFDSVLDSWTTKDDGNGGRGLQSIGALVKKINGQTVAEFKDGQVHVKVILPFLEPPMDAMSEFIFCEGDYVIAVDDSDVHLSRESKLFAGKKVFFESYLDQEIGTTRIRQLLAEGHKVHFLCDNNMGSNCLKGIDLIKRENLQNISILVTSDMTISSLCRNNGIRYLHKKVLLANFPIKIIDVSSVKLVNIDDDPTGFPFNGMLEFNYFTKFISLSDRLHKNTPIFMDYSLNTDDMDFETRINWLKKNGFADITVHTASRNIVEKRYNDLGFKLFNNKADLLSKFYEITNG